MWHRTSLRLLLVMALAIAGLGIGRPASAGCTPGPLSSGTLASAEGELASLANGARASVDVGRLAPDGELAAVARSHAARMAEAGRIFHSDDLSALFGALDAVMLAENVGMGCAAGGIHEAFLASPSHRSNLLNGRLTHAGYGAASGPTGTLFVTQVFAAYPPPADPAPTPVVTPSPAPVPAASTARTPVPSTPHPTPDPTPGSPTSEPAVSTPDPTAEPTSPAGFDEAARLVSAAGSTDGRLGGTGPHDGTPSGPLAAGAVLTLALALVAVWWSRAGGSTMWSRSRGSTSWSRRGGLRGAA